MGRKFTRREVFERVFCTPFESVLWSRFRRPAVGGDGPEDGGGGGSLSCGDGV